MSTIESSRYTPFSLSVVSDREEVAVVPVGELDLASVDELERALLELRVAGFESIVIDLGDVDFIDSTGLRVLITSRNQAKRDGHALALVSPPTAASRIFDITGTRGLFDWQDRFARPAPGAPRPAGSGRPVQRA